MKREELLRILEETGALLKGHFQLSSGRHSEAYVQCAQILQYPWYLDKFCTALANLFNDREIDLIIAPAMGGVLISNGVGRALKKRAIFTERENGQMRLRRNFYIQPGEKVLIVEDVVTTGKSVREVMEVVRNLSGKIVGIGSFIDRSGGKADFDGVKFKALLTLDLKTYMPEECPFCKAGVAVTKPGSRFINR
ncbi:orotate phosphoribosyltransferase [Anoxybacter fermentans]|uniref:Orotate phosphoribosyltransferase n=1 Tax=Anoxybacter fermentans TaxID=1323375 RepID=A0A3Q9HQA5_9FIRM|nr:orotate phosphoribosyltransferase [Anoxybacter fermentans]AZR73004.1 orotate phosphoribosyltransferase [Anoxybacter fermentans]